MLVNLLVYLCSAIFASSAFARLGKNNACKSFWDYATIETNKNCYFNPDVHSNAALIAKRLGYPLEKYKVTTEDGYILTLFRIPHNNTDPNRDRQPVVIQHGIGGAAVFWMLQKQKSLAFFLADNGYDVWLSSARGAQYSEKHKNLTKYDPTYWNFSFHEMGIYDTPAIIETVRNITGHRRKLVHIGHSMGTTMSYIYSGLKKEHAETHLQGLISLSPVAFMKNIQGMYAVLAPFVKTVVQISESLGIYAMGHLPIFKVLIDLVCGRFPNIILCMLGTSLTTGIAEEQVQADLFAVFLTYFPSGTSLKTLNHFSQIILSGGQFQYFDYESENSVMYNSSTPPLYDVSNIELPIHLFIGNQDFLAGKKDVDILFKKLTPPEGKTTASKYYFNMAHNDWFMGGDLTEFYRILLEVIKKVEKT